MTELIELEKRLKETPVNRVKESKVKRVKLNGYFIQKERVR